MTGNMSIMDAIKRAISPIPPCRTPPAAAEAGPSSAAGETSFTDFVLDRLRGPSKQLFAVSFAAQMKVDKHALVFDLADALPWLGIDRVDNAVRLLIKHFKEGEYRVKTVFLPKEENPKGGRPGKRYLISLDIFEDLLMLADTKQGRDARKMYKQLRDAVQEYMKMEMEARAERAQAQIEARDARLQDLEMVQSRLQATIDAQKRREEKKEARKRQQKEPLETAYLMTNMPDDDQGPYKSGCTGGDAKKRAKAMQTGNHEEMKVVASAKCVDSKLIEDVMHRIFHDYRTNDKLEWFDANLKSMRSVMKFVVRVIDGFNCVNHDDFCVEEALEAITGVMDEKIFGSATRSATEEREVGYDAPSIDLNPVNDERFRDEAMPRPVSSNPVAKWLSANCLLTGVHEDKYTVTAIHEYHTKTTANRLVPVIGYKAFCAQIALCGLPSTSPNNRKMYHGLLLQAPAVDQLPSSSQASTSHFLPD